MNGNFFLFVSSIFGLNRQKGSTESLFTQSVTISKHVLCEIQGLKRKRKGELHHHFLILNIVTFDMRITQVRTLLLYVCILRGRRRVHESIFITPLFASCVFKYTLPFR